MPRRIRADILAIVQSEPLACLPAFIYGLIAGDMTYESVAGTMEDVRAALAAEHGQEAAAVHPATERAVGRREGAVEMIPIRGPISNRPSSLEALGFGTSAHTISRRLNAAVRDPEVKAIVLDIDSPGGTVTGVDELASEIFAMRGGKPIVAQVDGMAASAAYWIAASADEIVSGPTSYAGSIGVYSAHQDISKQMEMEGIKITLRAAGKYKVEDNPFEPLSEGASAAMQERVDHFYDMFVKAVARGRGTTPSAVREGYGEGRILAAGPALAAGMIDKVRTMAGTLAAYGVDVNAPAARRPGSSAMARRRREVGLLEI